MLTIDGNEVDFKEGATVLEVAVANGIYIPTLCTHSGLLPFGACRLCLVKIEKMRGFPPACTTPAAKGMKIITNDPELNDLRKNVLELILSEHPHSCIICDKDKKELCGLYHICPTKTGHVTGCAFCPNKDRCELKQAADYLGVKEIRFPFTYKNFPLEREDPFFDRDYNLCILCGRCVRVCQEIRGIGAISLTKRGHDTKVGTAFNKSHLDGGCQFCGACVDACPTGALSARGSKWHGVPDKETTSTCALCSVGCGLKLETKWDRIMAVRPDTEGPANQGQACVRGRFAIPALVNGANRLKYPLVRRNNRLVPATWDEATELAAARLGKYLPEETAFLASPFITNEAAYLLQKFARVCMGTNNIDTSSFFSGPVIESRIKRSGMGAETIEDIAKSGWIIIIGDDLLASHPVLTVKVNQARKQGAFVSLIGHKRDINSRMFDLCVSVEPSGYFPLIAGILKIIVEKEGFDKSFVTGQCNDFDKLKNSLKEIDIKTIAGACGISQYLIEKLTSAILSSGRGSILYGPKILECDDPEQIIGMLFNILLFAGSPAGLVPLMDGANSQGTGDMGALPNFLPGYQDIGDKDSLSAFENRWSAELPKKPGLNYPAILNAIVEGSIKALYVTGGGIPREISTEGLDFLVLHDIYPSPLFETADIVFPAAAFTEEDGTITSLERRVQPLYAGANPVGMSMPDWKIICKIAEKMDVKGFEFSSASEVFDEICKVNALISGHGIWDLKLKKKFTLTPVEKTARSKRSILYEKPLWHYRSVDLTEKVSDLKILHSKIFGG